MALKKPRTKKRTGQSGIVLRVDRRALAKLDRRVKDLKLPSRAEALRMVIEHAGNDESFLPLLAIRLRGGA